MDEDVPITINGEDVEDPIIRAFLVKCYQLALALRWLLQSVTDLGPNDYVVANDGGLRWARCSYQRTILGATGSDWTDRMFLFVAGVVQYGSLNFFHRFQGLAIEFDGEQYFNAHTAVLSQERHLLLPGLTGNRYVDRFGHIVPCPVEEHPSYPTRKKQKAGPKRMPSELPQLPKTPRVIWDCPPEFKKDEGDQDPRDHDGDDAGAGVV